MKTFQKPLSASEEKQYLRAFREGSREARDILIERNMRLVAHVVKKYGFVDRDMEDLLSIGTIGLIKAVNTFDMEKGSRLATYAAKCIDKAILTSWKSLHFYSPQNSRRKYAVICELSQNCAIMSFAELRACTGSSIRRMFSSSRQGKYCHEHEQICRGKEEN